MPPDCVTIPVCPIPSAPRSACRSAGHSGDPAPLRHIRVAEARAVRCQEPDPQLLCARCRGRGRGRGSPARRGPPPSARRLAVDGSRRGSARRGADGSAFAGRSAPESVPSLSCVGPSRVELRVQCERSGFGGDDRARPPLRQALLRRCQGPPNSTGARGPRSAPRRRRSRRRPAPPSPCPRRTPASAVAHQRVGGRRGSCAATAAAPPIELSAVSTAPAGRRRPQPLARRRE